jgi:DNA-binding MarR family transcriptional regulator
MEPSTLTAIQAMMREGLVKRVRSKEDRRRLHIFLTPKGQELKPKLLPIARDVVAHATRNFVPADIRRLRTLLGAIQMNLGADLNGDFGGEE